MSSQQACFPHQDARRIIALALEEDLGSNGDITTAAVFPRGRPASARLVAREEMVVAGLELCAMVYEELAARCRHRANVRLLAEDGQRARPGQALAQVRGDARAVFAGERVMLNLLGRLCGIATATARAVEEIAGMRCTIADTRKTTPGLRLLEKYAVAVGGGENHRLRLDSLVMIKDNHKFLAGGIGPAIDAVRAAGHDPAKIEVEVDDLAEFEQALELGVGWILLDNMGPEQVRQAAQRAAGRCRLEVSGGLQPGRLRAYAQAGADRLSLGALTHSARAVDLGLDLDRDAAGG